MNKLCLWHCFVFSFLFVTSVSYSQFSPDSVAHLSFWINSDSVHFSTGNQVAYCYDLSGHKDTAIQRNVSDQPSLVSNALCNRNGLYFDGVQDFLSVSDTLKVCTTFLVAQWTGGGDCFS